MNISQIRKVANQRPLNSKEQAILFLWNQTNGYFPNSYSSLSDAVLNFHYVFSDEEIHILTQNNDSFDQVEFDRWEDFIDSTRKCDLFGFSCFQATLSLINELPLLLANKLNPIFSITLNKQVDRDELFSEIHISFSNYYKSLISVLVNQYFLCTAFDNLRDLSTVRSLNNLYTMKIGLNEEAEDIRTNNILNLIELIPNFFDLIIDDYLKVVQERSLFKNQNVLRHGYEIKEYVKDTMNQYYPGIFPPIKIIKPLFE
ncbi:MAG: hypothetical protein KIH89_004450 [Candidatus Shapirobacteria bacterium]|nr:hypothetical protein [Candidatus Shapirobacteria bacterium]